MLLKSSSMWVSQLLVHQMELIISSSKKEYNIDLSQKNIHKKNRQSNDRATRLLSVWSWWPDWSIPTISHTSAAARSSIRFLYLCITNRNFDQITIGWSGGCGILPDWRPAEAGSGLVRSSCGNCAKTCKVNCLPSKVFSFCLYVEFRNSEAHQELVDKAQLIQETLTEKREE